MNKTTRKGRGTSNTSNSNFNAYIQTWSESSSVQEEEIGIHKDKRKSNFDNKTEEVKGKSSEEEEIKILKCSRKSHVKTVNK